MMINSLRKMYDDFRHYGEIIHSMDTVINDKFYTAITIKYNGHTTCFLLCNGEVVDFDY